jgi:hypothetical protein
MLSRSYGLAFNASGPSTASFVERESAIPFKGNSVDNQGQFFCQSQYPTGLPKGHEESPDFQESV